MSDITQIHLILSVINLEGGFVNHRSDPGGATMYGISSAANPELADKIENGTLQLSDAVKCYSEKYWNRNFQLLLERGHIGMCFVLFDAHISGQRRTIKAIQKFLNDRDSYDLKIDGIVGPATVDAILEYDNDLEIIRMLSRERRTIGSAEAEGIKAVQQRLNLPSFDYTEGMVNRLAHRCKYGEIFTPKEIA